MSNFKYLFSIFATLACVSFINVGTANATKKKKCCKSKYSKHYDYDYGYSRERRTYWREPTVLAYQRAPIIRRSVGVYGHYQHPYSIGGYDSGSYSGTLTIEAGVIDHRGYSVAGGYNSGYLSGGSLYGGYGSSYNDYDSYHGGYGNGYDSYYGGYGSGYGQFSVEYGYGSSY